MEFWRSYDGTVALGWFCAVAFVAATREASHSDEAFMVQFAYGVMVAAVVILALMLYLGWKMKRRAENMVRTSDLIQLTDIQVLAKSNSQLLEDAIALRHTQMEQGRSPSD